MTQTVNSINLETIAPVRNRVMRKKLMLAYKTLQEIASKYNYQMHVDQATNKFVMTDDHNWTAEKKVQTEQDVILANKCCDFISQYEKLPDEVITLEPTTVALFNALKNPNYLNVAIFNSRETKNHRPCFGCTTFKNIKQEDNQEHWIRFKSGNSEFLICNNIEKIEMVRDAGNYQDDYNVYFLDCPEPLELTASWYRKEIE